jgi:hypothetical protein
MPTALTPHQIIADIAALNRIERDWSIEGRLDAITEADLRAKKAELLDDLRTRFTTIENYSPVYGDWMAYEGDMDCDLVDGERYVPTIPVGYGATEIEAIETLLEMIGETV